MLSKASVLAAALGVTGEEITAARRVESSLSVAATGMDKAARNRHVADQLGLTVSELEGLRRLLNGDATARSERLVEIIRHVARKRPVAAPPQKLTAHHQPAAPKPEATAASSKMPKRPTRRPRRKSRAATVGAWTPETTVFVTDWGDRVHWRSDCAGTRAFGKGGRVVQAKLADRICAGRSACEVCFGEAYSGSEFASIGRLIDRLHGRISNDQPVRRQIAKKAKARFGAGAPGRTAKDGRNAGKAGGGSESTTSRSTMMTAKNSAAAERVNAERRAEAEAEVRRKQRKTKGAGGKSG